MYIFCKRQPFGLLLPPMLLPQANRVSPSTVLLRLSTTPSMCRTLTTSEAAALINIALTMKPSTANSWGEAKAKIQVQGVCHLYSIYVAYNYITVITKQMILVIFVCTVKCKL